MIARQHHALLVRVVRPPRGIDAPLVVEEIATGARHEFGWATMPTDCRRLTPIEEHALSASGREVGSITGLVVDDVLINTPLSYQEPEVVRVVEVSTDPNSHGLGRVVLERIDTGIRYARTGTSLGPHWRHTTVPTPDTESAISTQKSTTSPSARPSPSTMPFAERSSEDITATEPIDEFEQHSLRSWRDLGASLFEPARMLQTPDLDRHPDVAEALTRTRSAKTADRIREAVLDGWFEASTKLTDPLWSTLRTTLAQDLEIVAAARSLGGDPETLSQTESFATLVTDKLARLPDTDLTAVAVRDAERRQRRTGAHRPEAGLVREIAEITVPHARLGWTTPFATDSEEDHATPPPDPTPVAHSDPADSRPHTDQLPEDQPRTDFASTASSTDVDDPRSTPAESEPHQSTFDATPQPSESQFHGDIDPAMPQRTQAAPPPLGPPPPPNHTPDPPPRTSVGPPEISAPLVADPPETAGSTAADPPVEDASFSEKVAATAETSPSTEPVVPHQQSAAQPTGPFRHASVWSRVSHPAPTLVPPELRQARTLVETARRNHWLATGRFLPDGDHAVTYVLTLSGHAAQGIQDLTLHWRHAGQDWQFQHAEFRDSHERTDRNGTDSPQVDLQSVSRVIDTPLVPLPGESTEPALDHLVATVVGASERLRARGLETYDQFQKRVAGPIEAEIVSVCDQLVAVGDVDAETSAQRVAHSVRTNLLVRRELTAAITDRVWIGKDFSDADLARIHHAVEEHTHDLYRPKIGIGEEGAARYTAETYVERNFDRSLRHHLWQAVAAHIATHRDEVLVSTAAQLNARRAARTAAVDTLLTEAVDTLLEEDPVTAQRLLEDAYRVDPTADYVAGLQQIIRDHYGSAADHSGTIVAAPIADPIVRAATAMGWHHVRLPDPTHAAVSVLRHRDLRGARHSIRLVFDDTARGLTYNSTASGASRLGGGSGQPFSVRPGALPLAQARRLLAQVAGRPITDATDDGPPVRLTDGQRRLLSALTDRQTLPVLAAALADPDAALPALLADQRFPPPPREAAQLHGWGPQVRVSADAGVLHLHNASEPASLTGRELAAFARAVPEAVRLRLDEHADLRVLGQILRHEVLELDDQTHTDGTEDTLAPDLLPGRATDPVSWETIRNELADAPAVHAAILRRPLPPHHLARVGAVREVVEELLAKSSLRSPSHSTAISDERARHSAYSTTQIIEQVTEVALRHRDRWWTPAITDPDARQRWRDWAAAMLADDPIIGSRAGLPLTDDHAIALDTITAVLLTQLPEQFPDLDVDPTEPATRAWLIGDIRITIAPAILPGPVTEDSWQSTVLGYHPPPRPGTVPSTAITVGADGSLRRHPSAPLEDWGTDYHAAMVEALHEAGRDDPVPDYARALHIQVTAIRADLAAYARPLLAADPRLHAAAATEKSPSVVNRHSRITPHTEAVVDAIDELRAELSTADPSLDARAQQVGIDVGAYLATEIVTAILDDLRTPPLGDLNSPDTHASAPAAHSRMTPPSTLFDHSLRFADNGESAGSPESGTPGTEELPDSTVVTDETTLLRAAAQRLLGTATFDTGVRDVFGRTADTAGTYVADTRLVDHLTARGLIDRDPDTGQLRCTPAGHTLGDALRSAATEPAVGDRVLDLRTGLIGVVGDHLALDDDLRWAEVVLDERDSTATRLQTLSPLDLAILEPAALSGTQARALYHRATSTAAGALAEVNSTITAAAPARESNDDETRTATDVPAAGRTQVPPHTPTSATPATQGAPEIASESTTPRKVPPQPRKGTAAAQLGMIAPYERFETFRGGWDGSNNITAGGRMYIVRQPRERGQKFGIFTAEAAVGEPVGVWTARALRGDDRPWERRAVRKLKSVEQPDQIMGVIRAHLATDAHTEALALNQPDALARARQELHEVLAHIRDQVGAERGHSTAEIVRAATDAIETGTYTPTDRDRLHARMRNHLPLDPIWEVRHAVDAVEEATVADNGNRAAALRQAATENYSLFGPPEHAAIDGSTRTAPPATQTATNDSTATSQPAAPQVDAGAVFEGLRAWPTPEHLPISSDADGEHLHLPPPPDAVKLAAAARARGMHGVVHTDGSTAARPAHFRARLVARTAHGIRRFDLRFDLQLDDSYTYNLAQSRAIDRPIADPPDPRARPAVRPGRLIHDRPAPPGPHTEVEYGPELDDIAHEIWELGRTNVYDQPEAPTPRPAAVSTSAQRSTLTDILTGLALAEPDLLGPRPDPGRAMGAFLFRRLRHYIDTPAAEVPGETTAAAHDVADQLLAAPGALDRLVTKLTAELSHSGPRQERHHLLLAAVSDGEDQALRRAVELGLDLATERVTVIDHDAVNPVYRIEAGGSTFLSTLSRVNGLHSVWLADELSPGWERTAKDTPVIGWPTCTADITALIRDHTTAADREARTVQHPPGHTLARSGREQPTATPSRPPERHHLATSIPSSPTTSRTDGSENVEPSSASSGAPAAQPPEPDASQSATTQQHLGGLSEDQRLLVFALGTDSVMTGLSDGTWQMLNSALITGDLRPEVTALRPHWRGLHYTTWIGTVGLRSPNGPYDLPADAAAATVTAGEFDAFARSLDSETRRQLADDTKPAAERDRQLHRALEIDQISPSVRIVPQAEAQAAPESPLNPPTAPPKPRPHLPNEHSGHESDDAGSTVIDRDGSQTPNPVSTTIQPDTSTVAPIAHQKDPRPAPKRRRRRVSAELTADQRLAIYAVSSIERVMRNDPRFWITHKFSTSGGPGTLTSRVTALRPHWHGLCYELRDKRIRIVSLNETRSVPPDAAAATVTITELVRFIEAGDPRIREQLTADSTPEADRKTLLRRFLGIDDITPSHQSGPERTTTPANPANTDDHPAPAPGPPTDPMQREGQEQQHPSPRGEAPSARPTAATAEPDRSSPNPPARNPHAGGLGEDERVALYALGAATMSAVLGPNSRTAIRRLYSHHTSEVLRGDVLELRPHWRGLYYEPRFDSIRLNALDGGPLPADAATVGLTESTIAQFQASLSNDLRRRLADTSLPEAERTQLLRQALALDPSTTGTDHYAPPANEPGVDDTEVTSPPLSSDTEPVRASGPYTPAHPELWRALGRELSANANRDPEDDQPSIDLHDITYHRAVLDRLAVEKPLINDERERAAANEHTRHTKAQLAAAERASAIFDAFSTQLSSVWVNLGPVTTDQLTDLVHRTAAAARRGADPLAGLAEELTRMAIPGLDNRAVVGAITTAAQQWRDNAGAQSVGERAWAIPVPDKPKASHGKAALAKWLAVARNTSTDDRQRAALQFAADALTKTQWSRGGGIIAQGRQLAELAPEMLSAYDNNRSTVDATISAIADLADELDRLGYGVMGVAMVKGNSPHLSGLLRDYARAYRDRRVDLDTADGPRSHLPACRWGWRRRRGSRPRAAPTDS
ncbi:hypothetical protein ACTD5D_20520 [Nocardia takedensis]|uniref:hypothetical protein n=1 Tax=Nocardia takedensis TaxID=259390 RepID=UPI003F77027E